MLTLSVGETDAYDEELSAFIKVGGVRVDFEHSLVSLSKWESHFKKPFLSNDEKTPDETLWYIRAMALTPNVPPEVFYKLSNENISAINEYISDSQTATWFSNAERTAHNQEVHTAEIIYYWMITMNIPFECQYWHLNRLLTLIRVCNQKNAPAKKMSRREILLRNRQLNEQRKKAMNTTG